MNDNLQQERQLLQKHNHNGIDSDRLDPQFFLNLPLFSTVPISSTAPPVFLYSNGGTHRVYFRHDIDGTASLYYVALTKV
jgi:hypothetical protein